MPCVTGPVLERELTVLDKLEETKTNGKLLVLGGSKLTDSIGLLSGMLDSGLVNKVCIGGLLGELFLKAKGVNFGKKEEFFKEHGVDKLVLKAKALLDKYNGKLVLPIDIAVKGRKKREEVKVSELPSEFETMDIGRETTELFKREIRASSLVVFNGPMGVYENEHFSVGTKKILESIAFHRCFSIVGGGDTEKALMSFGLMPQDFSHTSLAGKALLQLLSGEPLPGLEILEEK